MSIVAKFHFDPVCSVVRDKSKWILTLLEDWWFEVDGRWYCVPKGYFCDGASIPKIFWPSIGKPCDKAFWAAAIAHDLGYWLHFKSRPETDEIFYQFLIISKVNKLKAKTMWLAVRVGAGWAWPNTRQDKIELIKLKAICMARPDREKFDYILRAA